MIQIGDQTFALDDPAVLAAIGGVALLVLFLVLLVLAVRAAGRRRGRAQVVQQILAGLRILRGIETAGGEPWEPLTAPRRAGGKARPGGAKPRRNRRRRPRKAAA